MKALFSFLPAPRIVRRPLAATVGVVLSGLVLGQPAAAQSSPPAAADASSGSFSSKTPAPSSAAPARPYEIGFQTTLIAQILFRFRSPYTGPHSLRSATELRETDTYTLYLGARPDRRLELYLDPEWARGLGVGGGVGLAGYTSGEVIRAGIKEEPVLARYFGRWMVPTGCGVETVEAGENQIAGARPAHRLVITAGKLAVTDLFDVNRYANSARTQFMNWALINNVAYDYAADTRGYSQGVALEWAHPDGALRLGSFQTPTVANGPNLAGDLIHNRGDQIEAELHPHLLGRRSSPSVLRVLGYRNVAHMGRYRDALALARRTGTAPDITAVERPGTVKYGYGLNFEQALADDGNTGLFGRWGWNDGATESFAFTECDRSLSFGGQLSGATWRRPGDHVAVGLVQNELSAAHRDYLAAGGLGFQLGDGRLRYGPERILESYYAYALTRTVTLSFDYQFVSHPGYNRDRGPASVFSFRTHWEF